VADDLRRRCIAALEEAGGGLPLTHGMAVDAMLEVLREHSCEHCQDSEPALCVFAPCGPDDLRRHYAERTVQAWRRYGQHWRERAETAEKAIPEILQAKRGWQITYCDEVNARMEWAGRAVAAEERAEKAEAALTPARERLDALVAAGFGATTDTLRALRAALDDPKDDRG
jgi:hypothetical protein